MCQSRRFLDGHAHLNGPLGKIARFFPYFFKFCPFLCDFCNLKRCPGKQFQQHVVITAPTSERYLECYPTLVMQALQTSLTHQTASLAHCTAREYLTLTITSYWVYHWARNLTQCWEPVLPMKGSQETFNTMVIWRIFPTKEKSMGNILGVFFFKWEILHNMS